MWETEFWTALLMIVAIDILLGGDNAVVIAMASRRLPADQKKRAILWGTGLAIAVRMLATLAAALLLKIPYLFLTGGLLLVWIAYKLLVEEDNDREIKPAENLWQAIKTIVVADVLMGLDNVLAVAGAAGGDLTLIIIGLLISVPIMIWGSRLILGWMERFPWIVYIGSGILAWTAAKMIAHEPAVAAFFHGAPILEFVCKLLVAALVIGAGWWKRTRLEQKAAAQKNAEHQETKFPQDKAAAGS